MRGCRWGDCRLKEWGHPVRHSTIDNRHSTLDTRQLTSHSRLQRSLGRVVLVAQAFWKPRLSPAVDASACAGGAASAGCPSAHQPARVPTQSPRRGRPTTIAAATQDPTRFASQQLKPFSAREQLQHRNPAYSPSTGTLENRCLSEASPRDDLRPFRFSTWFFVLFAKTKTKRTPHRVEAMIIGQSARVRKPTRRRTSRDRFPSTSHSRASVPQPVGTAAV